MDADGIASGYPHLSSPRVSDREGLPVVSLEDYAHVSLLLCPIPGAGINP